MLRILLSGCNGYMGKAVSSLVLQETGLCIIAGVDTDCNEVCTYPVYGKASGFKGEADVIIDFSSPSALDDLLEEAKSRSIPLVLCTTGYSPNQLDQIEDAAAVIPVFRSGNMSLGINLIAELVRRACEVLGEDFDVEIIERHHRRKLDAPSGTAIMLADAAASALPYAAEYVFERESRREPRSANEIGISSVRGGNIVGEHSVIFAGAHEVIEINHSAASREVFAAGAVKAAKFMADIDRPGLFSMSDVLL